MDLSLLTFFLSFICIFNMLIIFVEEIERRELKNEVKELKENNKELSDINFDLFTMLKIKRGDY